MHALHELFNVGLLTHVTNFLNLQQTIDEVENLIKKHEAFEKAAAAQEERFAALERLTTVSCKFLINPNFPFILSALLLLLLLRMCPLSNKPSFAQLTPIDLLLTTSYSARARGGCQKGRVDRRAKRNTRNGSYVLALNT